MAKYSVSLKGSGFIIGSVDAPSLAAARKIAIEFAAQLPQSKKRTTKTRRTSKGPLKTFYWTRSDGRYGTVKAASAAEARKKKRGAKIHTRKPFAWM